MAQGGFGPPPGGHPPPPGGYASPPGGYASPPAGYAPQGAFTPAAHAAAPPPGATPPFNPAAVIGSAQAKGFVKGLFDFSFETFIALKVMRVLYGLFLAVLAFGVLAGFGSAVISMLNDQFLAGLGLLVVMPFLAVIYLIVGRVYFELIIVAFKIAEDADEIAKNTRRQ